MTALEIFLSIVLWIIIGLWISYKRNWYQDREDLLSGDKSTVVFVNVLFMPVVLIITIFHEYLNKKWEE